MIIPSPEWKPVIEEILEQPDIVMLLGAIDTGKSSFAQNLIQQGIERGLNVALVDSDMGQSTLGPPGTIGMTIFSHKSDSHLCGNDVISRKHIWGTKSEILFHFIGATKPIGHFLATIVGIKKLVEKSKSHNATLIIVDTTGLVYGDAAKELKFRKIELVNPKYLVAFQRNNEIEHLLIPQEKLQRNKIYRLPVSDKVILRTPDNRRAYREKKFAEYFISAKPLDFSIDQIAFHNIWFNTGRKLNQNEYQFLEKTLDTPILYGEKNGNALNIITSSEYINSELYKLNSHFGTAQISIFEFEKLQNMLIGLNSEQNETLALGLIQDIEFRSGTIKLLTPLSDFAAVRLLEFGFIRIDRSGKELGRKT